MDENFKKEGEKEQRIVLGGLPGAFVPVSPCGHFVSEGGRSAARWRWHRGVSFGTLDLRSGPEYTDRCKSKEPPGPGTQVVSAGRTASEKKLGE